jgi:hypothetical protein
MNEEILGGLKSALERGESMKKAMMTFFNSGYKKEEIEEAARALSEVAETKPQVPVVPEKKQVPPPKTPPQTYPKQTPQKVSSYGEKIPVNQPPKPAQKVSTYDTTKDAKGKKIIFILFFLLAFLVVLLILIFLFKQQLIDFFSRFFT